MAQVVHHSQASTLADVLDRILDKGVVVAGDVAISLVGVELLTIRLRLLISSVDKAQEMGISWWETDPFLNAKAKALETDRQDLLTRIEELEAELAHHRELTGHGGTAPANAAPTAAMDGAP